MTAQPADEGDKSGQIGALQRIPMSGGPDGRSVAGRGNYGDGERRSRRGAAVGALRSSARSSRALPRGHSGLRGLRTGERARHVAVRGLAGAGAPDAFRAHLRVSRRRRRSSALRSAEVKKFAGILYPECLAPVEFTDYEFVASNV